MITAIIILSIQYFCIEGIREAYYFDAKERVRLKAPKHIHLIFNIQRFIVLLFLFGVVIWQYDWLDTLLILAGLILMFPFFHDGSLYWQWHKLDDRQFKKGFWSDTRTSTALINIGIVWRVIFLVIGISLTILTTIL